jgi:hypothetical protein
LPTELVDFFKKQKETGQFDGRRELQSTNAERQVTRAVTSSEQLLLAIVKVTVMGDWEFNGCVGPCPSLFG